MDALSRGLPGAPAIGECGVAGYCGTPLAVKLGITPGATVALLDAPARVLADLDPGGEGEATGPGTADVVVAFFTERAQLARRVDPLGRMVHPDGGLWVAWPKRACGVPTTVTDEVIREVALPLALVDNKVCAIDATWSGLRLVWRRAHRGR